MSLPFITMACSSGQSDEQEGSCSAQEQESESVKLIHPHELAKDLHSDESYFLLDCQPLLAYNTCHITGINLMCTLSLVWKLEKHLIHRNSCGQNPSIKLTEKSHARQ